MGIFKKNKQEKQNLIITVDPTEWNNILNTEVLNLFPKTGEWNCTCFSPDECREIYRSNLPCNLYDEKWLSTYFKNLLAEKHYSIPPKYVEHYVQNSQAFQEQCHAYTLEIVKWQINWIMNGGDGWLMPKGFNEFLWETEKDCDKCFRLAVIETLSAIGLKKEDIEEGLEKNANLWRDQMMNKAFLNEATPKSLFLKDLNFIDENNTEVIKALNISSPNKLYKDSWLLLRKINYYKEHKEVLDKFNLATPEMKMDGTHLESAVAKLAETRKKEIQTVITKLQSISTKTNETKQKE